MAGAKYFAKSVTFSHRTLCASKCPQIKNLGSLGNLSVLSAKHIAQVIEYWKFAVLLAVCRGTMLQPLVPKYRWHVFNLEATGLVPKGRCYTNST